MKPWPTSSVSMLRYEPVNERGCRVADPGQEGEAAEIAGELLVPFEAAKLLAREGQTNGQVALRFGVGVDLAR
ncbi:hypothetical protein [Arthrobacter sp. NPDC093139]|uniref:hypothetical protein n=1 Tax=Arthrobacter sp. NPDC093139 TaxID=3363945 RepID=UPI003800DFF6